VHAFGSVVFMQENMDIKDRFATSSKEHLRSLVRVHELDEITSNGGKDRSATRNTPGDWSIKDWTSCAENLHLGRKDDIVKIMQVEGAKCITTWGPTEAKGRPNWAEMGLGRSAQPTPVVGSAPFPCTRTIFNTKTLEAPPFDRGESHSHQEAIHKLERGGRSPEGDRPPRRKHPQVEKKTPSEGKPWSTVLCLALWWGNLLIHPWVVIDLEM
jgi:hypothetical protein